MKASSILAGAASTNITGGAVPVADKEAPHLIGKEQFDEFAPPDLDDLMRGYYFAATSGEKERLREELIETGYDFFCNAARHFCKGQHKVASEDLTQQFIVNILKNPKVLEGFTPGMNSRIKSYLFTHMEFIYKNLLRKENYEDKMKSREMPLDCVETSDLLADKDEDRVRIANAIENLPDQEASIVRLVHFEELSFVEIQRRTGMSRNRASRIYQQGFTKLKSILAPELSEISPYPSYRETFGSRIANLREARGLLQKSLAKEIGVTADQLFRIEHDRYRRQPDPLLLDRLADRFKVKVGVLSDLNGPYPDPDPLFKIDVTWSRLLVCLNTGKENPDNFIEKFSEWLKTLRTVRGYTIDQVIKLSGIESYTHYEYKTCRFPGHEITRKLSEFHGVKQQALLAPTMADKCEVIIRQLGGTATPRMIRDCLISDTTGDKRRLLDWVREVLLRNKDRFIQTSGEFKVNNLFQKTILLRDQIRSVIEEHNGEATTQVICDKLMAAPKPPNRVSILNELSANFRRIKKGVYGSFSPDNSAQVPVTLADHIAGIMRQQGPMKILQLTEALGKSYDLVKLTLKRGFEAGRFYRTGAPGEYGLKV